MVNIDLRYVCEQLAEEIRTEPILHALITSAFVPFAEAVKKLVEKRGTEHERA